MHAHAIICIRIHSMGCLVIYYPAFFLALCFKRPRVWVPPANKAADNAAGNWPVANLGGSTHFSFHVPDNMDETIAPEAFILIIPTKDGDIDYNLTLTVGDNGDPHISPPLTIQQTGQLFSGAVKDELTEIDVSSIFNEVALTPGSTYASLKFDTAGLGRRVVGMRFQYTGFGGSGGGAQSLSFARPTETFTVSANSLASHVVNCPSGYFVMSPGYFYPSGATLHVFDLRVDITSKSVRVQVRNPESVSREVTVFAACVRLM